MRVWIDLTNTAHVVVLRPLVERLEDAGHEVELTARPLSHTLDLLDDWGHPYTALGAYGASASSARRAPRRTASSACCASAAAGASTRRSRTAPPTCPSRAGCCASPTRRCSTTSSR